ncbi:Cell wall glucanase [Lasiodiplodia theobromae]|uniref:Cell wall glucanase n=1 Tax=Lasiodiplodia theobromae TaxID=45133 RepID=UPI0015C2EDF1|nr:Cell wall glucanase [Lasiodiplodia theobromae]KAF4545682.1 Cell wall glucanase [Lasiodiplodia theobromae]
MKAGFFIQLALAIMFGLVAGLPQYGRNALEPRAYVTTVEVVTVTLPAVIVHVHGTRTTWVETLALPTSTTDSEPGITSTLPLMSTSEASSAVLESSSSAPEAPIIGETVSSWSITSSPTESSTPTPAPPTTLNSLSSRAYSEPYFPQFPTTTPTSVASGSDGDGFGIGYNPYNGDGTCKDHDSITQDINSLKGYGMVRLYGTDCNQLDAVVPAVKNSPGMKLFLGIWHCETTDVAMAEANTIVNAVNNYLDGDWSLIHTVSVGNEVIDRGEASVDSLLATLKAVKNMLRPFGVPVVTVETPGVFQGVGKSLCQASDYTAINAHPFFDKSGSWTDPSRAGEFTAVMESILGDCGHDRTVIAETGWPHGSDLGSDYFSSRNLPVPSPENHLVAIDSLRKAYADRKQNLVVFSAFDDLWKKDTDLTMGVEHYWGILN